MYLDFNEKKYITANLKFSYANQDFNPLLEEPKNVNRNVLKESMFLNKLRKSKFMYDAKKKEFVLANDDDIYRFITIGIDDYSETAIIYGTDEFNSKKMRINKKISRSGSETIFNEGIPISRFIRRIWHLAFPSRLPGVTGPVPSAALDKLLF